MSRFELVLHVVIAASSAVIAGMLAWVTVRLLVQAVLESRRRAFDRAWQPRLYAWMDGETPPLPPLPRRHRLWMLRLWNRTRSYVEGEAAERLRDAATGLDLASHAVALLHARAPWKRVLGVITLGELRALAHWRELHRLLDDPHPLVTLTAVEAMVRIDVARAAPLVVPALLARSHWDPVRVGRLMKVMGAEAVEPLRMALSGAAPGAAERTLRWLGLTEQIEVLDLLRGRLRAGASAGEIAVILEALGRLGEAADRTLALRYLGHEDWRVRMQAVKALGQVGLEDDRALMAGLLTDLVWWVRYRAAGALYQLRGETVARFRRLAEKHPDRYARDALWRVLSEKAAP